MAESFESEVPKKPRKRNVEKSPEKQEIEGVFLHFDDQMQAQTRSEARACGEFRKELKKHGFSDEEAFNLTMERFFPGGLDEDAT